MILIILFIFFKLVLCSVYYLSGYLGIICRFHLSHYFFGLYVLSSTQQDVQPGRITPSTEMKSDPLMTTVKRSDLVGEYVDTQLESRQPF